MSQSINFCYECKRNFYEESGTLFRKRITLSPILKRLPFAMASRRLECEGQKQNGHR
jgi:hypothetical protein